MSNQGRNGKTVSPLFILIECDGGDREAGGSTVGRVGNAQMNGDIHLGIDGKSRKVATFSATVDHDRDTVSITFSMDGVNHTKTFSRRG